MEIKINVSDDLAAELKEVAGKLYPGDNPIDEYVKHSIIAALSAPSSLSFGKVGATDWSITGVDEGTLRAFAQAAATLYESKPDIKPDQAWKEFLLDTILSVVSSDERVLQISGIPTETFDGFSEVLKTLDMTPTQFVSRLIGKAAKGQAYVWRSDLLDKVPENAEYYVFCDVPAVASRNLTAAWAGGLKDAPEEIKRFTPHPMLLLGHFIAQAAQGGLNAVEWTERGSSVADSTSAA